jgi:two-component system sensor histidine kinase HydH
METGGALRIKVQPEEEQIVWTIADSGVGIPPENIPHIFDPYFTTKPHGVGLGLAIVHKLIEAHDGDIEAASSPGQGTTFTVRIPRLDAGD